MLRKVYLGLCAAVLVGYALSAVLGWELESAERQTLPQGVRQAPGGYRSDHFWRSGFQGGK
ncbi:MAG: hypothetical protein HY721_04800 [Planctomycetes bacterium]|nr:hypothetical protein [Planctomycetota bacterium]